VFGNIVTDSVEDSCNLDGKNYLAVEELPGQFDPKASSAMDCVKLIDLSANVFVKTSRLLIFDNGWGGACLAHTMGKIRKYYMNPVISREKNLLELEHIEDTEITPVPVLLGFSAMTEIDLEPYCKTHGLAMNADDLREVVNYFKSENRDPNETELKILDTYWSDHCRHTTFMTELSDITIDESFIKSELQVEAMNQEQGKFLMILVGFFNYVQKNDFVYVLEKNTINKGKYIYIPVTVFNDYFKVYISENGIIKRKCELMECLRNLRIISDNKSDESTIYKGKKCLKIYSSPYYFLVGSQEGTPVGDRKHG
jgi:hypothetical protein